MKTSRLEPAPAKRRDRWLFGELRRRGVGWRVEEARLDFMKVHAPQARTRAAWAKHLHMAPIVYKAVVEGERSLPSAIYLRLIDTGISLDWIYMGQGPMLLQHRSQKD